MQFQNWPISTVWLDLDDTLIDFHANSTIALHLLYTRFGLSQWFSSPELWIETYQHHNHALWALYNNAQISRDELRQQRFTLPFIQAGMDSQQADGIWQQLDKTYLDFLAAQRTLVPGALELLKTLRSKNVKIAIISNGFKEVQYRKIKSAGLESYIDLVVLSDDIDINKPDIRLFNHAMKQAGDSNPQHHLLIGDNPATDIAGALNAGWHAILFNPASNASFQNSGQFFTSNSLKSLCSIL